MTLRPLWHRSSIAFFTLSFSLLLSVGLASALFSSGLSTSISVPTTDAPEDEGGDGYQADDDCGFVKGISAVYKGYKVNAKDVSNADQACLNAFAGTSSGEFFESTSRHSYLQILDGAGKVTIVVDLSPNVAADSLPSVSLLDGKWTGYGKIISPSVPDDKAWVWFDWVCKDTQSCQAGMAGNETNFWVTSNTSTGITSGYAWSDYVAALRGDSNGFVSFQNLDLEVPPMVIVPYVEIEAIGTGVTPGAATRETAPQANGVDYWRVGIHFVDMVTGEGLTEADIQTLTMSLNTTDSVFLNQVKDKLDAVDISTWHPTECPTGTGDYCVLEETEGSTTTVTFNKFIRSYAPTSNMLWMDEEVNLIDQDLPTDRDGCVWIYLDQIRLAGLSAPVACLISTASGATNPITPDVKWDYFYARSEDRNYIYLDDITFNIELETSQDYSISTDGSFVSMGQDGQGANYYEYTPASTSTELSFSPRFVLDGLYAEYDGYDKWTSISENIRQEDMYLIARGFAYEPSAALKSYLGGSLTDRFTLNYQLDAGTDYERDQVNGDAYLVMDVVDGDVSVSDNNVTNYQETVNIGASRRFAARYAMGYGQRGDQCSSSGSVATGFTPCTPPIWDSIDYLTDPTVEVWACDAVVAQVLERRKSSMNGAGCYFVGYLPVIDRHAEAGGVLFMGSTSEFLGLSLDDSDDIFSGGAQETLKIRNNFYELGTRYTQGVTAGSGLLDLDNSTVLRGDGESLMGGSLYYFNGDVDIEAATSFSSATTYVKGGDVYINGNIGSEDSRLGIIALSENGVGGNVYIDPSVTDLYVNIFADGIIANQSSTYSGVYPSWLNEAFRVASLMNQLYINGSVSGRITMNESDVYDELGYYSCDGTEVTQAEAMECALEKLRQFRLCYELDPATGGLGTDLELCDEGESLSAYGETYAATDTSPVSAEYYPSVILDYTAPGNLPIFASSGVFN